MDKKCLVYGLRCPLTDEYKYIGKSSVGIKRAHSHFVYSHNGLVNIWIKELRINNTLPVVDVLEYCNNENLSDREEWWINFYIEAGCSLLNSRLYGGKRQILVDNFAEIPEEPIGDTIRRARILYGMTQNALSKNCDVSRRTILNIEKGDTHVSFKTLIKVCDLLGLKFIIKSKNNLGNDNNKRYKKSDV